MPNHCLIVSGKKIATSTFFYLYQKSEKHSVSAVVRTKETEWIIFIPFSSWLNYTLIKNVERKKEDIKIFVYYFVLAKTPLFLLDALRLGLLSSS